MVVGAWPSTARMKLVLMDAAFEEKTMRPAITILTRDSMVPEDMGFILDFNPQQGNDEAEAAAIPVGWSRGEMIGLEIWW